MAISRDLWYNRFGPASILCGTTWANFALSVIVHRTLRALSTIYPQHTTLETARTTLIMSGRTAAQVAGITALTAVTGLLGYAIYFDYQRRNNPEFRKGISGL